MPSRRGGEISTHQELGTGSNHDLPRMGEHSTSVTQEAQLAKLRQVLVKRGERLILPTLLRCLPCTTTTTHTNEVEPGQNPSFTQRFGWGTPGTIPHSLDYYPRDWIDHHCQGYQNKPMSVGTPLLNKYTFTSPRTRSRSRSQKTSTTQSGILA